MKKQDVFKSLAVLAVAGALVAGCAGSPVMDKMKSTMTNVKNKVMGKKKTMKGDEAAVKARKKLMRGIGADMKRLRAAMKQGSGWVVEEQVRQAAGDMYKKASKIKKAFQKNTLAGKTTSAPRHLEGEGEVRPHRGRPGRERRRARADPLQGRACGHQESGGPYRQAMRRMPPVVPEEKEKIATLKKDKKTPAESPGFSFCGRRAGDSSSIRMHGHPTVGAVRERPLQWIIFPHPQ